MDAMDRRTLVRGILSGAAIFGASLALPTGVAEAMPVDLSPATALDDPVEEAQWGPHPHWHGNHRGNWHGHRGRRHVCWWHRGRRVCGWH